MPPAADLCPGRGLGRCADLRQVGLQGPAHNLEILRLTSWPANPNQQKDTCTRNGKVRPSGLQRRSESCDTEGECPQLESRAGTREDSESMACELRG